MAHEFSRKIVVDLNFMWAPELQGITQNDEFVIPHEIIADIVKSPTENQHITMFERFLRIHQRRLCVAHSNGVLESLERRGTAIRAAGWLDTQNTAHLRGLDLSGEISWSTLRQHPDIARTETSRASFLEFCRRFAEQVELDDQELSQKLRAGIEPARRAIRDPKWGWCVPELYATHQPEYNDPKWRPLLETFPDVFAIGRWSRLLSWYGFKWAVGHGREFPKNFDDAAYALAASYAGFILTRDAGLKKCVEALFPSVQIL